MTRSAQSAWRIPAVRRTLMALMALLALELALVAAHVLFGYFVPGTPRRLKAFVNLALPGNLPTWVSTMLFAGVGALAFANGSIRSRTTGRWSWYLVGVLFVGLSIDDACEIHEKLGDIFTSRLPAARIGGPVGETVGWLRSQGVFAWIVYLGPVLLVIGVALLAWMWRALRGFPQLFRLALLGFCVMGFSQVLEIFQGAVQKQGWRTAAHVSVVLEEFMEMVGTTLLLTTFLARLYAGTPGPHPGGARRRSTAASMAD